MAIGLAAPAAIFAYLVYSVGGLGTLKLIGLYITLLVPFVGGFFVGMALIRPLRRLADAQLRAERGAATS